MHKKNLYIASLFWLTALIFFSKTAHAQFIGEEIGKKEIRTKRSLIKIDPSLFFYGPIPGTGEYRISTEFSIGLKSSIQIGGSFVGKSIPYILVEALENTSNTQDYTLRGFRFQFAYKYYPFGNYKSAPEGFFIGPHVSLSQAYFHIQQTGLKYSDYTVTYGNLAVIFGYQFIFNKFAIEVFQGFGYRDNRMINDYTGEEDKLNYDPEVTPIPGDLKIYFGANFGYLF
jgi:hypothetical protein